MAEDWADQPGYWLAALVVDLYDRRGHFDTDTAAVALSHLAGREIPPRFATLLAGHLSGTLGARKGDAAAFMSQTMVREHFENLRAHKSYDETLFLLTEITGLARPTIEKYLSHTK